MQIGLNVKDVKNKRSTGYAKEYKNEKLWSTINFICMQIFWHKWIPVNESGKCAFCQRCGATLDSYRNSRCSEDHNTRIYFDPISQSPLEWIIKGNTE